MRPEVGTCRGSFEKWYFNEADGECHIFEYGGCDGNENNFNSKEACESKCMTQTPSSRGFEQQQRNVCNLPSDMGPCRAALARFFYNADSGKCEMFMYGGCSGNENNFMTIEDCQKACTV